MSLRFVGGEQLQRGRGIGGLLRLMKSVFSPIMRNVSKGVISAAKSEGGKKLMNVLKEQAINSTMNLASQALQGSDIRKSLGEEIGTVKQNVAATIDDIRSSRKRQLGNGVYGLGKGPKVLKHRRIERNHDFFD